MSRKSYKRPKTKTISPAKLMAVPVQTRLPIIYHNLDDSKQACGGGYRIIRKKLG